MILKLFNCSFFHLRIVRAHQARMEFTLKWICCCNLNYFHPSRSCSPRFSFSFWWLLFDHEAIPVRLGSFLLSKSFFFLLFIPFHGKWRFLIWMWTQSHTYTLSSSTIWAFNADEHTSNLVEKMMDAFHLMISSTTTKQRMKKIKSFLCSC